MITRRGFVWRVPLDRWLTSILLAALMLCAGRVQARTSIDLSGPWQYQISSSLTYPPSTNWAATTVPGYLSSTNYARAWFRKEFTLPPLPANHRVKLRFGGVKYNSTVYINGHAIGGCYNGYDSFELDATAFALTGVPNELLIAVGDWTTYFSSPVTFTNMSSGESVRDQAVNVVLAPIGGHFNLFGIWEPVSVEYAPQVAIANVRIATSVRNQKLSPKTRLRNESTSSVNAVLHHRVTDGTNIILSLPDQPVTLAPGQVADVDASIPWTTPRLWSPEDPFLYYLESSISSPGQTTDLATNRFGFREFWTSGDSFYLNGTKTHLLAAACWPPTGPVADSVIRQSLLDVKAGNNKALRLHTQPWPSAWYRIADEVGLLIVEEAAVWCDPRAYRLGDPVFWTNYANHLSAAVQRDANHPSIIMWSLENEILHCGGDTLSSSAITNLARMGLLVKSLDPTRPITFEADLDPGGVADVLGLHYPHEFPDFQLWPDTAYWLDQPLRKSYWPGGSWKWDRTKPLYIGEYLWVPDTAPEGLSILFGDAAYFDRFRYRTLAKAWTWQMQIEAYRSYGVSAHCPWTMVEDPAAAGIQNLNPANNGLYQLQKTAYHPYAVTPREYDSRFFSGETVSRTLSIYNDTSTNGTFILEWRVNGSLAGSRNFALPPAEQRTETITFAAPASPGAFTWDLLLWRGSALVFSNSLAAKASAPTPLTPPSQRRVALYDPAGSTSAAFGSIPHATLTNLATADYSPFDCLIIGRHALKGEPVPSVGSGSTGSQWQSFMQRGGWILLLEQTNYPAWIPLSLTLSKEPASFGFPVAGHPITVDLEPEQLRWWRDGHTLCASSIQIPSRGSVRPIIHTGSQAGLDKAALLEAPIGRGGLICSQLLLIEKLNREPMAGTLLQRLLNHIPPPGSAPASSPPSHPFPACVALLAEPDSATALQLNRAGLISENLTGRLATTDLNRFPLLILAGTNAPWVEAGQNTSRLLSYVQAGGTLLIHRPTDAFLGTAAPLLIPGAGWSSEVTLPIVRGDANPAPTRITNHDLHWADASGTWNVAEVLSTNIASRVYRKAFNLATYTTLQAEQMPIKSVGGPTSGGWILWANGYVAQTINITQPGQYQFGIVARGTPQGGGWPHMVLRIDGTITDAITVTSADWQTWPLSANLTAGSHELAIAFDNDSYSPPEDRNLLLDQVRYGLDPTPNDPNFLTKPGALVEVRRGAGRILFDEINWETPGRHAERAGRYMNALLTECNALVRSTGTGVKIEAEAMILIGAASAYTNSGVVWLNSSGKLQTIVRFTETNLYTFGITGGGSPALGVYPRAELLIDSVSRGSVELASASPALFTLETTVPAGVHSVQISFINDFYAPPEDRNMALDNITIDVGGASTASPQLLDLYAKKDTGRITVAWMTQPGKSYVVEYAPAVGGTWREVATVSPTGTAGSWTDEGTALGTAPFTPGRPASYYRVKAR